MIMTTTIKEKLLATFNKGGQFVSMIYNKSLTPNKENKGKVIICQQTYKNMYVGGDYQTKVLNQMRAAGIVKPEYELSKTWGEHENPAVVTHNGVEYMQAQIVRNTTCTKAYYVDGELTDIEIVKTLCRPSEFAPKKPCQKQIEAGVANEVQIRRYILANIQEIAVDGERLSNENGNKPYRQAE